MSGRAPLPQPGSALLRTLLRDYRVPEGVSDELLDGAGRLRPTWRAFLRNLGDERPEDIPQRFARGDRYLRDAGVYFRQYSDTARSERDWPLSHIPVVLHQREWDGIAAGLIQRAELLERVVADLYGDRRLISDGHLPGQVIAQSPEWLRPLVGTRPASGHYLHFLAFEIGRSPDGSWFVLGDRTQAPSGAGFALENRMAARRVFPEAFARARVTRLAGFFRSFLETLEELATDTADPRDSDGRIAILTPGPSTDTYFEHTYIARYLGLMLLEGEDLTVRDGRVMVRTVAGLQPVSVLWRRLDADFADPLELRGESRIGTPGLVSAQREGALHMVNALGAGILEIRALMAFLPRISEALTGAPLLLPNIATWWCGQAAERALVTDRASRMLIGPALSTALPFGMESDTVLGGTGPGDSGDRSVADWIEAEGAHLVGQEAASLSTTPVWDGDRLVPRPMTVRVFAARTMEGWTIMPGGYARVGRGGDATALAMQQGGSVADVWITNDAPVSQDSLIRRDRGRPLRQTGTILPSRAADNLLWLGRYVERCEGTIRLLRAWHRRLAETGDADAPLLESLRGHLDSLGLDTGDRVPGALLGQISAAETCAGRVRDRFSVDAWLALRDLAQSARSLEGESFAGDDTARAMGVLLRKITGFAGLVHENMYRFSGWRFLAFGRALERADAMAHLLGVFTREDAPEGAPDLLVELGDSVMTHQRRYHFDPSAESAVDLLALDDANPRSILFQVAAMRTHAGRLPKATVSGRVQRPGRDLLRLETALTVDDPQYWTPERLLDLRLRFGGIAADLSAVYLS